MKVNAASHCLVVVQATPSKQVTGNLRGQHEKQLKCILVQHPLELHKPRPELWSLFFEKQAGSVVIKK